MVSCQDFLAEFGDYLENTAGPELRARIEAHLRTCRACRVVLDSSRKTSRFVTVSDSFTLPTAAGEGLVDEVMARIKDRPTQ